MNPLFGILLQLLATLSYTLMGAMVRFIGDRVPLGEVVFARGSLALVPLFLMLAWRGELASAVRTSNLRGHLLRSFTNVSAVFCNYASLSRIPLADATAIGFATPLFSVVLAALLLGEVVRRWRWTAVIVGLIGVLVMLSPHLGQGPEAADGALGAILALAAAFLFAMVMTQVRHLSATETTASLVFIYSVIASLVSLVTVFWGWVMPAPADLMALAAAGILGGSAQILLTDSFRHAPASVLAPFAYTSMLWAVAIGYFWFGEIPETIVLTGAAMVIAAGLTVIWREQQTNRKRNQPADSAN